MRTKNAILLTIIACVGGVVFFFVCKHIYESKLSVLKSEAKNTFIKAFGQVVESRNVGSGPLVLAISEEAGVVNIRNTPLPDSVHIANSTGVYRFKLNKEGHYKNITMDTNERSLHSFVCKEYPIQPDSLNLVWKKYLNESGISMESALCISVTDEYGNVTSESTSYSEWRKLSNLMFTVFIGYACEIEVMAYLHYSVWDILYMEIIWGVWIYIACMFAIYKFRLFIRDKIFSIRNQGGVEKSVVKIVKEMKDSSSIRTYQLCEGFIFHADQNLIECNGQRKKIQPQPGKLLELFLRMEESGYVLKDSDISRNLWPDGSATNDRIHKAIARLRSNIKEFDSLVNIEKCSGGYQLVLTERPQ